jgi:1-acyl-sn-glycerol-3-phosphate acyltransferase
LVEKHDGLVIVIAPEGTRKKTEKWKTGFLRIAEANNCKIQMGALDFEHKRILLGDLYQPTGDNKADIANIKQWYTQFKGKYPDQF